jgi:hypothetical protein
VSLQIRRWATASGRRGRSPATRRTTISLSSLPEHIRYPSGALGEVCSNELNERVKSRLPLGVLLSEDWREPAKCENRTGASRRRDLVPWIAPSPP